MRLQKLFWHSPAGEILMKDLACDARSRSTINITVMFAVVTLSSVSVGLSGEKVDPVVAAALLWIILYFSSTAGLSKSFVQEQQTGTMFSLQVYAQSRAVLCGKLLYSVIVLGMLSALIIPLFIILFDVSIVAWPHFILTTALGTLALAITSTFVAAMAAKGHMQGALFTVLAFPLLLPVLLSLIRMTAAAFIGAEAKADQFFFIAGYDAAMMLCATVLFEYVWRE